MTGFIRKKIMRLSKEIEIEKYILTNYNYKKQALWITSIERILYFLVLSEDLSFGVITGVIRIWGIS